MPERTAELGDHRSTEITTISWIMLDELPVSRVPSKVLRNPSARLKIAPSLTQRVWVRRSGNPRLV